MSALDYIFHADVSTILHLRPIPPKAATMKKLILSVCLLLALYNLMPRHESSTYSHKLVATFDDVDFKDAFEFVTSEDSNDGYVEYVNETTAFDEALALPWLPHWYAQNYPDLWPAARQKFKEIPSYLPTVIRGDWLTTPDTTAKGRKSVSLRSKQNFGPGTMVVASFSRVPIQHCGVWPSFSAVSVNTSSNDHGEIRLYNGANMDTVNLMFLKQHIGHDHSDFKKKGAGNDSQTRWWRQDLGSFGENVNQMGGVTFAMDIASDRVRVWALLGSRLKSYGLGLHQAELDVNLWPEPTVIYNSTEARVDDFNHLLGNVTMNLKINFCGEYAGGVMWARSGCKVSTGVRTCEEYVRENAARFVDTVFQIEYINFFESVQLPLPSDSMNGHLVDETESYNGHNRNDMEL